MFRERRHQICTVEMSENNKIANGMSKLKKLVEYKRGRGR